MRFSYLTCLAALTLCITAFAQQAPAPQAPQHQATQVTGEEDRFTIALPPGWQHDNYERLEERPNAYLLMQLGLVDEEAKATDNLNLTWYEGHENILMGVASFHRIEQEEEMDVGTLLAKIQADETVAPGMQVQPVQVGRYPGLLMGGVVQFQDPEHQQEQPAEQQQQQMLQTVVAAIPQQDVCYMATLLAPPANVQAQWEAFGNFIVSLEAQDLEPQRLEDVIDIPMPEE